MRPMKPMPIDENNPPSEVRSVSAADLPEAERERLLRIANTPGRQREYREQRDG
ncbi:MAG TPA: hypothetical protein VED40_07205 [Azospirillaceae bacterium]|nr:hypothetical protein [Azospirillaceae bacterium]